MSITSLNAMQFSGGVPEYGINWGGIAGGIIGGVLGGPAGATAGYGIGTAATGGGHPSGQSPPAAPTGVGQGFAPGSSGGVCAPGDLACWLKSIPGQLGFGQGAPGTAVACQPKGYHLNKHVLAPTRGGCGRTAHGWIGPHQVPVRNRRMNPFNHHAAIRSIHRLKSLSKHMRRIQRFVGPHRSAGSCSCSKRKR